MHFPFPSQIVHAHRKRGVLTPARISRQQHFSALILTMKVHQFSALTFTSEAVKKSRLMFALAAAVCLAAGCATKAYQAGDSAAPGMPTAATEVQAEQRALDDTVAALGELVNAQGGDLSIPFTRYSYSLDRLIAAAHRTEATGTRMEVKNAAYVQA